MSQDLSHIKASASTLLPHSVGRLSWRCLADRTVTRGRRIGSPVLNWKVCCRIVYRDQDRIVCRDQELTRTSMSNGSRRAVRVTSKQAEGTLPMKTNVCELHSLSGGHLVISQPRQANAPTHTNTRTQTHADTDTDTHTHTSRDNFLDKKYTQNLKSPECFKRYAKAACHEG